MLTHGAVSMVYDGDGNRVSEAGGGVTTTYLVDTLNPTGYSVVVQFSNCPTTTSSLFQCIISLTDYHVRDRP
jgi:hypothetical protein